MSFACVTNYLGDFFPQLLTELKNGECRFLALNDGTATDAQGFISSDYSPRTVYFLPCSWNPEKKSADEKEVAAQTRASAVYEIRVAKDVVVLPSDQLEMKFSADDVQILEILSVVNQSNVYKQIFAININE